MNKTIGDAAFYFSPRYRPRHQVGDTVYSDVEYILNSPCVVSTNDPKSHEWKEYNIVASEVDPNCQSGRRVIVNPIPKIPFFIECEPDSQWLDASWFYNAKARDKILNYNPEEKLPF